MTLNLLRLRSEHEAWHMVAADHVFGSRMRWKRVWVVADEGANPGGAVEATTGAGPCKPFAEAIGDIDEDTRQCLIVLLVAARWGTAKKYGEDVANTHAYSDLKQEALLCVNDGDVRNAIKVLEDARLDERVQYVAQMLERVGYFSDEDCRDVLRSSRLSSEDRAAEDKLILESLAETVRRLQP